MLDFPIHGATARKIRKTQTEKKKKKVPGRYQSAAQPSPAQPSSIGRSLLPRIGPCLSPFRSRQYSGIPTYSLSSECMDGHVVVGGGAPSAPSMSPTSPRSLHHHDSFKRKRSTVESSPGSLIDEDQSALEPEKKRQPGVKRACNECRQQKVSQPSQPSQPPSSTSTNTLSRSN